MVKTATALEKSNRAELQKSRIFQPEMSKERSFEMQRAENEFGETSWDQDAEDYRGDEYIANNTNQNNFQTSFEADLTGVSEVDNQPQHLQNSKPREETFGE